jgi:hypothetical protein
MKNYRCIEIVKLMGCAKPENRTRTIFSLGKTTLR